MKDYTLAKQICKNHGVKGFRKMKLKRPVYLAGKQTIRLNPHIAARLMDRLKEEGYEIAEEHICRENAKNGVLDCLSIS